uniref:Uncharacterized protein n=1 Tax=Panagrolaimus sp. ES5 TaxID=591445 RepID=A0AC34GIZ9_9BILA
MENRYIQRSITTQSTVILRLRQEKRRILSDIQNFKLELKAEDEADINWLHAVYHPVVIENIQYASGKVNELLRKFEEFRELFPTFRAMIETEKDYTVEVNTRIGLLYMWQNTLNDLFSKIKSIREYFDFITGYRKRSSFSIGYGTFSTL